MTNSEISKDSDIHVINRESQFAGDDNSHGDILDTPTFMQSLDLPTPTPFSMADEANNSQFPGQNPPYEVKSEFGLSPSLSPLTEFINNHGEQVLNQKYDDNDEKRALTRFTNPLPPLAPLSDPVILNIPLHTKLIIPDYISNSYNAPNRSQMMIGNRKKKEQQGPKTRPAFVMKIWSMVNDDVNHDYIRWNDDGETFQVFHREEFMKSILPKYFKHNNFASFVRQLNMYGWHKVQDISSGSMAKDERNQDEVWQFKNPCFIRGREDLLDKIVRNKTGAQESEAADGNQVNFSLIMSELDQIKMNQLAIIEDMRRIRKDNQTLWTESFSTRERHQKQSQTLDKIMKFLETVYGSSAGKIFEVDSVPFEQPYNQVSVYNNATTQGYQPQQQTHNAQPAPILKPRLMLMDQAYQKTPSTASRSPATTKDSSVEEIVRNNDEYGMQNDPTSNVNRIYQNIMNHDPAASPRHYFPELNSPYIGPGTPGQQFMKAGGFSQEHPADLQGLEQNIHKQGQALLQVQDWIQTLADRQLQQQQQLQQQRNSVSDTGLDDFDVNEFLDNNLLAQNQGNSTSSNNFDARKANQENIRKRYIEEVQDDDLSLPAKRRTRK